MLCLFSCTKSKTRKNTNIFLAASSGNTAIQPCFTWLLGEEPTERRSTPCAHALPRRAPLGERAGTGSCPTGEAATFSETSCVWLRANLVANNLRLLLLSPPTAIALTVSVTCVPQLPQTNGAQEIGMRAEGPLAEKGHIWGGGPTLWQSMPLTLAPPRVNTPSLPPPS